MIDLFAWPQVKAAQDALCAAEAAWLQAKRRYRIAEPGQRTRRLAELQDAMTQLVAARLEAERAVEGARH